MNVGIDIAGVVKQDASNVVAEQRKTQFRVVEQESTTAHGKARDQVARACLIIGEAAMGGPAASEQALRQWNHLRRVGKGTRDVERQQRAESDFAGQHELPAYSFIRRIPSQNLNERRLGAERLGSNTGFESVVNPLMRVGRIVAPVLNV